ncbi:hypothetical protein DFQ04_1307 [Algoriphagus boseongensis]|uniref:Uncharacterized protein n=1 Tax=Algoriphagus boseongensis TaxID=1442587 RepID=A0A4R6T9N0_9BACT|nr:hypothetical protein [Algoriphagus boseongensis]TDQ19486.1 hypothetical protein DFQ04_1307 [Algoriphagus boseongensis]
METITYTLGDAKDLDQLFPDAKYADHNLMFQDTTDVIRHYTKNSIHADGIEGDIEVKVSLKKGKYQIEILGYYDLIQMEKFKKRHQQIFSSGYAFKAIRGKELMEEFGVWNPMEGYPVNWNPMDGKSKWTLFPPLGLNVMGQKGMLLLHYPPWAVLQAGTFDNAMTMQRWSRLLVQAGIPENEISRYKTFIDVNPVAAPGSGESEYPNDYMPIMMAKAFFDGPSDRDYIKSMMELYLTPPDWPDENKYTLPILIGGSPLYDPQSPGWFRTTYTDILPQDANGIPQVNVLQAGKFRVYPHSKRETPYLIVNHMIAASVTGRCTNNPAVMPDIRLYEAQDLVAATFLKIYKDNPNLDPLAVRAAACNRWFGNTDGKGAPTPADDRDKLILCALAQMDLFFAHDPKPHPKYTFEEAMERCQKAKDEGNPCCPDIKPDDR